MAELQVAELQGESQAFTLPLCHFATLPLCHSATLPLCNLPPTPFLHQHFCHPCAHEPGEVRIGICQQCDAVAIFEHLTITQHEYDGATVLRRADQRLYADKARLRQGRVKWDGGKESGKPKKAPRN